MEQPYYLSTDNRRQAGSYWPRDKDGEFCLSLECAVSAGNTNAIPCCPMQPAFAFAAARASSRPRPYHRRRLRRRACFEVYCVCACTEVNSGHMKAMEQAAARAPRLSPVTDFRLLSCGHDALPSRSHYFRPNPLIYMYLLPTNFFAHAHPSLSRASSRKSSRPLPPTSTRDAQVHKPITHCTVPAGNVQPYAASALHSRCAVMKSVSRASA